MKKELLVASALAGSMGLAGVAEAATDAPTTVDTKAVAANSSFFIFTPFELMNIH